MTASRWPVCYHGGPTVTFEPRQDTIIAHERAGLPLPWELIAARDSWSRVVRFIEKWFAKPLGPEDGLPSEAISKQERRLGVLLPRAVREWYGLLGRRPGVFAGMHEPCGLRDLELAEDGRVVLVRGHQGIGSWGVRGSDLSSPDPPVWEDMEGYRSKVAACVTDFYLGLLVDQVGYHYSDHWPKGLCPRVNRTHLFGNMDDFAAISSANYAPLLVPSLIGRAFGDADTIITLDGFEILSAATRTDSARAKLNSLFGDNWEAD